MNLTDEDQRRIAFLYGAGVHTVRHNSHADLLPHLVGTRDLLREWGAREALCSAGLFHSIYGTEYFDTATLSDSSRSEVGEVIGAEAEALVWLWCFGRRLSLAGNLAPGAAPRMQDRRTGEWLPISARQFGDLVDLWVADTLEQLPRVSEREAPTAEALLSYAEHALPGARGALAAACGGKKKTGDH